MKPKTQQIAPDDPEQSKRFIEAAIEAGPDDTGEKFEGALKRVARPKPRSEPTKKSD